jgi:hypothetical protein
LLLVALVALTTAQTRYGVQAQASLETRARSKVTGDTPSAAAAGDAQVSPSLQAGLESGGGRLLVGYAPILRVREPYASTRRWEFNQRQFLFAQWSREARPRPYLVESFYYGLIDMASLFGSFAQGTGTAPGGVIPNLGAPTQGPVPLQNIELGRAKEIFLDVAGGVAWPLSRTVTLDTSGGFFYGGGVDTPSRWVLPEQFAGRGQARLEGQLSEVTTLLGTLGGSYARFLRAADREPMAQFTLVDLTGRLRRQLLVTTQLELGVGGAVVAGYAGAQQRLGFSGAPIVEALLNHRFAGGAHVATLEVGARVSPFVDRFLATVYTRADGTLTLSYAFQERWRLSARGGVGRSLADVVTSTSGAVGEILTTYVEARAAYVHPRYWRVELAGTNSTVVIGTQTVNNWLVSLSLTAHTEGTY